MLFEYFVAYAVGDVSCTESAVQLLSNKRFFRDFIFICVHLLFLCFKLRKYTCLVFMFQNNKLLVSSAPYYVFFSYVVWIIVLY